MAEFGECVAALTKMALQEGKRGFVGEVYGELGVDVSLQLHQLPDPVARQEGEVWETLVDRPSDETRQRFLLTLFFTRTTFFLVPSTIPDGDHLPLNEGRVQLLHAADVPRPLELLGVDEEDRLFDPREDVLV